MLVLRNIAILFPAFLFIFTFRGFSRAIMARWMGDNTAYQEGFVTLNPLAHVDVFGLSLLFLFIFILDLILGGHIPFHMLYFLVIFLGVRWTYPVPYELRNFRNLRRGAILTILSGSLGCFLLAFIFLYIAKYMPFDRLSACCAESLAGICGTIISLASYFGVLALVPIPPFDGGKLLEFVLPYSKQGIVSWLEENSMIILLVLFLVPGISDIFFGTLGTLSHLMTRLLSVFVF